MSRATDLAEWLEGAKLCDDAIEWAEKLYESAAELRRLDRVIADRERQAGEAVTVESIRAAGGIVHGDGNIFFTSIAQLRASLPAPQAVQAPRKLTIHEFADLTAPWADVRSDKSMGIVGAAIMKFCEVNGIPAPSTDGKAEQAEAPSDVVAFEFYNPTTGHAIVDYTVNTYVGRLGKEQGYEARPLGYVNPPPAAVKIGDPVPLWQAREALDSLEESARGDAPYNHFAANIIRTALEQAATQPTASNAGERGGWKEAVIAWEVCASIHREWAKGKDALFTTRQADFVKHAADARAALASKPPAGEQKPVAHMNLHGVIHPVGYKWLPVETLTPLYTAPQPEQVAQDSARLDWLTEQLVDTIYLDDGRIIDVGTGRIGQTDVRVSPHALRDAIDAARARGEGGRNAG